VLDGCVVGLGLSWAFWDVAKRGALAGRVGCFVVTGGGLAVAGGVRWFGGVCVEGLGPLKTTWGLPSEGVVLWWAQRLLLDSLALVVPWRVVARVVGGSGFECGLWSVGYI